MEEFLLSICEKNKLAKKGMVLASLFVKWRNPNPIPTHDFSHISYLIILLYLQQEKHLFDESMNEMQIFKQVLLYIEQTCFEDLFSKAGNTYDFQQKKKEKRMIKREEEEELNLPISIKHSTDKIEASLFSPSFSSSKKSKTKSKRKDLQDDDSQSSITTIILAEHQYKMLQIDSKNIIKIINESPQTLPKLFNGTSDPWDLKYDLVVTFSPSNIDNNFDIESASEILKRGLSNRITALSFKETVTDQNQNQNQNLFSLGLILSKEHAFDILDLGPSAQSTKEEDKDSCLEFIDLWQGKSEIRKFADLSIRHVVSWETFFSKRHLIIPEIISYLLRVHFNIDSTSHKVDLFDFALNKSDADTFSEYHKAFVNLTKLLHSITNLPLSIVSIEASNNAHSFSHCPQKVSFPDGSSSMSTDMTMTMATPTTVNALDVIIWFESSSRWPNDLKMINASKQAFYLQIYRQLVKRIRNNKKEENVDGNGNTTRNEKKRTFQDYHSSSTNSDPSPSPNFKLQLCKDWLDIWIDGFVFRCLIGCRKEFDLLKSTSGHLPKVALSSPSLSTSFPLNSSLLEWKKTFVARPRLTKALYALHMDCILFGVVARMAKCWLKCQWMEGVIPEESLNIMIATIFMDERRGRIRPLTRISGFLRFLEMIANLSSSSSLSSSSFNDNVIYAEFERCDQEKWSNSRNDKSDDGHDNTTMKSNLKDYLVNIRTNLLVDEGNQDYDDTEMWSLKDNPQLRELEVLAKTALRLSLSGDLIDPEILFRKSLKTFDDQLDLVPEKRIKGKIEREQRRFLFAGKCFVNFSLVSLLIQDLSKKFPWDQASFYRGDEEGRIMVKVARKEESDQMLKKIRKFCGDLLLSATTRRD